jgi:Spy/CpxP family protein refolding chaperone
MKRTTFLTTAMALTITLLMIVTAQAKPFAGGNRGHGFGGLGNVGMRTLMQLDLSQDQKQTIYDILQKYRDEQQATRISMKEHKKEFFDMSLNANFDENKARQAFRESVPAMEEAFVLRARIKSDINAVLTTEQLEKLQQIRAENPRKRKGGENHEFRRAMLETWLLMDSE